MTLCDDYHILLGTPYEKWIKIGDVTHEFVPKSVRNMAAAVHFESSIIREHLVLEILSYM